jgi:hypothetical protein
VCPVTYHLVTEFMGIDGNEFNPYNLIQDVLIKEAIREVAGITVKEVLRKISDNSRKGKLKAFFQNMRVSEDNIVVDLKKNPGLYTALSSQGLYREAIVQEGDNGILIVNSQAQELIKTYGRDENFFEYDLLRKSLDDVFNNPSWGILDILNKASKLEPGSIDRTAWTAKLATEAEKYRNRKSELSGKFEKLGEGKVRLSEFDDFIDLLLRDTYILLKDGTESCRMVLEQTGLSAFSDRKYPFITYSMLINSAMVIEHEIPHDPLFLETGAFLSVLIDVSSQRQNRS